jgi:hypothetical protein
MQTKRHKRHKQKLYYMKGCSKQKTRAKNKSSRSRINKNKNRTMNKQREKMISGGNCAACSVSLTGGNSTPAAFVGKPWSIDNTNGNYLAPNLYDKYDAQTSMLLKGGRKTRKGKKRNIRGGGLFGELVNFNRDIMYNVDSAYSSLNGYKPIPSPAPYEGHLTKSASSIVL